MPTRYISVYSHKVFAKYGLILTLSKYSLIKNDDKIIVAGKFCKW